MSVSDDTPSPRPAGQEPPWLTDQEQATWVATSSLVLQLPGLLDAQLRRDADLGFFDYVVMSWLSMSPDHQMRMGELARLAQGSVSRLSNVVKRLEQRGFMWRAPDPTNGRYTLAVLSGAGWDKVVEAAPGHARAVRRYVFDPLTDEQVDALQQIVAPIADRIHRDADGDLSDEPSSSPA
ncbi:MAG: MarR family winged helix-turn-helix transcriptional regulator [Propionibacteriaceae bacterium]